MIETKEDLQKEWKKLLIDASMSEREFAEQIGMKQAGLNRMIREGSVKLLTFADFLHKLGYKLTISKDE